MKYDKLIQKAFTTAWKYKYLWVLGFFVGGWSFPNLFNESGIGHRRLDHLDPGFGLALVVFLVFTLFIFILAMIVLNRICEGGLIANAARIERDESHRLSTGWDSGLQNFWRMLGVMICYILMGLVVAMVLGVVGVIAGFICFGGIGDVIGTVLFILSLLILVPVLFCGLFVIAVAGSYSARFIVLENQGIFESIESGFRLFRQELGKSIIMGIIALVIGLAIAIGIMIVFAIMIVPLIPLALASVFLALIPGLLIILPLGILVNAYFGTFRSCLWTFFFMELRALQAIPQAVTGGAEEQPPEAPSPQFE